MRDLFAFASGIIIMLIIAFDHGNVPFLAYVFAGIILAFFIFMWWAHYEMETGDKNDE